MPLLKPVITERSMADSAQNRYTFMVGKDDRKTGIKQAVEKMFEVKVLKVQTVTMPGKSYRTGKKWLVKHKPNEKKAIVTIEAGKTIDLFETSKQGK